MSSAEKIRRLFAKSEVTVNSKVDDRIVSDALTAFNKSEETTDISAGPNTWRIIMNKTMIKVTAAAAIIAIVVVGMHYLGVSPDGAGVVWADVLRNVEAAQTVTFTFESEGHDENDGHDWTKGVTRIKGPVRCYDGTIGHRCADGQSNEETMIHIMDLSRQNRLIMLYPLKKCAYTADDYHANEILLTYDGLKKDFRDATEENLGEAEIDGRKAVGFRMTKDDVVITVWADPDTALPIQIERKANDGSGWITLTNITFGVELDDQLFDMTVPDDYVAVNMSTDEVTVPFELTEKHLVEGLAISARSRGGVFQTRFMGGRPGKEAMDKHVKESLAVARLEDTFSGTLAAEYVRRLPKGSEWQYMGEDVTLGDASKPVFWYRTPDSKTCRTIYGDLSVWDVKLEDLPEVPWPPRRK